MTTEVWTIAPVYTVAGIGPYAIPHPYATEAIQAFVTVAGARLLLTGLDYTLTPTAADATGNLYLSPAAAITHAGRALTIDRRTPDEQGWVGIQGDREKGLERQLDRIVQSLQEVRRDTAGALRIRGDLPVLDWAVGTIPVRTADGVISGPDAAQIASANDDALLAEQARIAAQAAAADLAAATSRQFPSRAAFVIDVAGGYTVATGITVFAGGLAFIKVSGAGISDLPGWESARRVLVGDTHIDAVDVGQMQSGYPDGTVKLQGLFDTQPIGSLLHFPPNFVVSGTTTPVMSRFMPLRFGHGAQLRVDTADPDQDALQIAVTDVGFADAIRNVRVIDGGFIWTNPTGIGGTGGRYALNINPTNNLAGQKALFQCEFTNMELNSRLAGGRIGGATVLGDTNFNRFLSCNMRANSPDGFDMMFDGCADGHELANSFLTGNGHSVLVNIFRGGYVTRIHNGNNLQGKKGGILFQRGDHLQVNGNTFERPPVVNPVTGMIEEVPGATTYWHMQFQGLDHPHIGIDVFDNNGGGGDFVTAYIYAANVQQMTVDRNHWNKTFSGQDIIFEGNTKHNTIGTQNVVRGARALQVGVRGAYFGTDANRRLVVKENPGDLGNRGIWQSFSDLTLVNSWTAATAERITTSTHRVEGAGEVSGGVVTAGTIITTLPVGQRPAVDTRVPFTAPNGVAGYYVIGANGELRVGSCPAAPNNVIQLSGMAFNVAAPLDGFDTGA